MNHTFFSRFQGSWLGSAIAEALAEGQELLSKAHHPLPQLEARNNLALTLIESQEFSLESTQIINNLKSCISSDRMALLLLPLIAFYTDNLNELGDMIQKSHLYSKKEAKNIKDGLIWGQAISLALREKLDVNNLIESILSSTNIDSIAFIEQLKIVNTALKTGKTIGKVVEELSSAAISSQKRYDNQVTSPTLTAGQNALALSLYCFGVAPENFELSICLAIGNKYQTKNVAALTAALSGAYNSFIGIPLKTRMIASQNPTYQQAMMVTSQFFNIWAGAHTLPKHDSQLTIVAASRTIQPRSSLKIISQIE